MLCVIGSSSTGYLARKFGLMSEYTLPRRLYSRGTSELSAGELLSRFESSVDARGSRNNNAKALFDSLFDVLRTRYCRARHVEVLARLQDLLNAFLDSWIALIAASAKFDRKIARSGPNRANPFDLAQDFREISYALYSFDDRHQQDLSARVERPQVGDVVIFLNAESPVARRQSVPPSALAYGFGIGHAGCLRIAARNYRRASLLDRIHMRNDEAVHAGIERLLDDPLVALARIRRDPHERYGVGLKAALRRDLLAVEQELKREPQIGQVESFVLHLEDREVVAEVGERHRLVDVPGPHHAAAEHDLPLFEQLDNLVEAWWHRLPPVELCSSPAPVRRALALWQPEHAFANDVVLNLVRAGIDRLTACGEHPMWPFAFVGG